MPERWQDELKKLRREEMPDGVRNRVEAGPRRELPNDGRQRLIAGVVAFVVFAAAGAYAWRAFDRAGTAGSEPTLSPSPAPTVTPGTLVLDLSSHPNGPSFSISYGTDTQEGIREGYSWCPSGSGDGEGCVSGIADFAYYPPVTEYLAIAEGTSLELTGDAKSFQVIGLDVQGHQLTADAARDGFASVPGRYVWNVKATWAQGDGNAFFGLEVLPPVDQIPDVLHVTCTPDRATADGTVVRAQADGVHIAIDASADVTGADIVRGASPDEFVGIGADAPQDGSLAIGIDPGGWGIGCYTGSRGSVSPYDIHTERVASFTVVDPEDRYAEPNLTCSDPYTLDRVMDLRDADQPPSADSIRDRLTGLVDGDTVREAGYGDAGAFKLGFTYVVQRNGETIARITLGALPGSPLTGATVEACPDARIDVTTMNGSTAPNASVPDVALVRCTDGVAEILTPTARASSDGVHILVEGPAEGADLGVVFQSMTEGAMNASYLSGSQDPREGMVREMGVGDFLVACYDGPDQPAQVAGGSPTIHVVDPEGWWVSTTLDCLDQSGITPNTDAPEWTTAEDAIRAQTGVRTSDIVEPAGYPEGANAGRIWRVTRDGSVVAWLRVSNAGDTWHVTVGMACADAGISSD